LESNYISGHGAECLGCALQRREHQIRKNRIRMRDAELETAHEKVPSQNEAQNEKSSRRPPSSRAAMSPSALNNTATPPDSTLPCPFPLPIPSTPLSTPQQMSRQLGSVSASAPQTPSSSPPVVSPNAAGMSRLVPLQLLSVRLNALDFSAISHLDEAFDVAFGMDEDENENTATDPIASSSVVTSISSPSQPSPSILRRFFSIAPSLSSSLSSPCLVGLSHLDLSLNRIGDAGACVIARSLAHNQTLTCLNVSYCHISDVGGIALSRSLAFNSTLRTLNLSLNLLTTATTTALADPILIHPRLESLDLSNNMLTDASVWVMTDSLSQSSTLTHLAIAANMITQEGAEALARCILLSQSLRKVDVEANEMSMEGEEIVAKALKRKRRHGPIHVSSLVDSDSNAFSNESTPAHAPADDDSCLNTAPVTPEHRDPDSNDNTAVDRISHRHRIQSKIIELCKQEQEWRRRRRTSQIPHTQ